MAEKNIVDFIERWQTGAFLVVATVLSGVILAIVSNAFDVPYGRLIGFFGGAGLAFLALSYLLYGR